MELPKIENSENVQQLIQRAIEEDVGPGDATTNAFVAENQMVEAVIVSRNAYTVSGGTIAAAVFNEIDKRISVKVVKQDGDAVNAGEMILSIHGPARSILTGERLALNFMQRMTGTATAVKHFVDILSPHNVDFLDTRKTTPGLRELEKYAVLCGGGKNHRFGLYDKVMIKDNHIAFWRQHEEGSIADAVRTARAACPGLEIEIEVESKEDLLIALEGEPDWVLLDNMSPDELTECVNICNGRCKLEASGCITLEALGAIAETGIDAVSVGYVTHSAPAADLSLEFIV